MRDREHKNPITLLTISVIAIFIYLPQLSEQVVGKNHFATKGNVNNKQREMLRASALGLMGGCNCICSLRGQTLLIVCFRFF